MVEMILNRRRVCANMIDRRPRRARVVLGRAEIRQRLTVGPLKDGPGSIKRWRRWQRVVQRVGGAGGAVEIDETVVGRHQASRCHAMSQEEKEALSRLEAQNLDTIQAMQIRMNLQQLFAMDAKTARRFLDRWNAWVQVCDLGPMKRLAKTIMAKADGILRSIATGLSNGVLEAINGNVQAAKRKAKGYRTKRNLKAIVYLIAGDMLANSPT